MAVVQFQGPLVIGGRDTPVNGYQADYNADAAPSMLDTGAGFADPRWPYQDGSASLKMVGWQGINNIPVIDQVPTTASTSNIAAAQAPVAGTALTLATTTTSAVNALAAAMTVYPSRQNIAVGTLVLDLAPAMISFGQTGAIQEYDLTTTISRAVTANWAGNESATGAYVTVKGYDLYGYAMTEKISGASGTTSNGKKAWKFITSVTPGGTLTGSNVSIGTLDIVGLPLRADQFSFVSCYFSNAEATATGFTAAVTTTATSATGDVRGTWAYGTADNTKRLQVFITPSPKNISTVAGVVGVTQA